MSFIEHVAESLDNNIQVDVIYTDFSKAFDRLNIQILLSKIKAFGVGGTIIKWFESYLRNRSQCVKFGGCTSRIIKPCSGIPQGSLLGPLLFVIYIDDLPDNLFCRNLGYADDFKVFRQIKTQADCHTLQSDIDRLKDWCVRNDMDLNIDKCSVITFTRSRSAIVFDYAINSQNLKRVYEIKDLGVIMDSKLTFDKHISYIFRRCNKLLGFIFRACNPFKSKKSVMFSYNSLTRSICEYGAVIWNPFYKVYTDKIERIQRKFTRMLYFKLKIRKPDYEARLSYLQMQKLSLRRIIIDEMYLFKVVNGHLDSDLIDKINFYANAYGTRSGMTFALTNRKTNIRFKCPSYRLQYYHDSMLNHIDIVNQLPVGVFKSIIERELS